MVTTKAQQQRITLEQFAQDIWEALREEVREQLGDSVTDEQFEQQIPPWSKLPRQAKIEKMRIARNETLRLLDRAGYEVRKKIR